MTSSSCCASKELLLRFTKSLIPDSSAIWQLLSILALRILSTAALLTADTSMSFGQDLAAVWLPPCSIDFGVLVCDSSLDDIIKEAAVSAQDCRSALHLLLSRAGPAYQLSRTQ